MRKSVSAERVHVQEDSEQNADLTADNTDVQNHAA